MTKQINVKGNLELMSRAEFYVETTHSYYLAQWPQANMKAIETHVSLWSLKFFLVLIFYDLMTKRNPHLCLLESMLVYILK